MSSALITTLTLLGAALLLPASETRYTSINVNLAMTVSEDSHRLTEDMVRICAEETNISLEELHRFRQNDFKSNTSEATQCFAHCVYEQMGLLRDGVFVDRDFIRTLAAATDPNTILAGKECFNIKGENKCETAYKIHQCRYEHKMRGIPKETATTESNDKSTATATDLLV
ncbi:general odorant-binding protein 56a-like [Teleopsis dalmanni]|uniref:general odorant-binding protein 56a-like n=1 Tax=Teleopsis dalmanni TaxID=139649 RepID=UPI0018CE31ED|nr:general odorant-binding protein 56a-like [Teleopsis dalmanni]